MKRQGSELPTSPAASEILSGLDPILEGMKRRGECLSLARWLELNYGDSQVELTGEVLAAIPDELQSAPDAAEFLA